MMILTLVVMMELMVMLMIVASCCILFLRMIMLLYRYNMYLIDSKSIYIFEQSYTSIRSRFGFSM